MGDKADNIPGIPGVGEKTAKKVIAEWGSVENLLENTDALKGKLKERVVENAAQARLSKELATIIRDVPVEQDLGDLVLQDRDNEEIKSLFTEFEFNALGRRLFGSEFVAGRGRAAAVVDEKGEEVLSADLKSI